MQCLGKVYSYLFSEELIKFDFFKPYTGIGLRPLLLIVISMMIDECHSSTSITRISQHVCCGDQGRKSPFNNYLFGVETLVFFIKSVIGLSLHSIFIYIFHSSS